MWVVWMAPERTDRRASRGERGESIKVKRDGDAGENPISRLSDPIDSKRTSSRSQIVRLLSIFREK